jgi:hypothetical protein
LQQKAEKKLKSFSLFGNSKYEEVKEDINTTGRKNY